jgi:hypothetical protein
VAELAPILRAVPDHNGEVIEAVTPAVLEARIVQVEDENREHLRAIRSQSYRIGELTRDKQAEAEADPLWPIALRVFSYHGRMCNHEGAEWTLERWNAIRPFLRGRKYGLEKCLRAIAGARFDSWSTRRKNGTLFRFDTFDVIFSQKHFEEFVAKAPPDWKMPESAAVLLSAAVGKRGPRAGHGE